MKREPRLPSLYRLVTVGRVEEVADVARRLARGGAEDGTLVWAPPAEKAPRSGDFTCAIVLRPEGALRTAVQLVYVAALGLYEALGSLLPPSVLVYEWPSTLVLNGGRIAQVWLEAAAGAGGEKDEPEWTVLRMMVHIGGCPPEQVGEATSLFDEGHSDITGRDVLERFARFFLSWTNRWRDEGFAPVRSLWLQRTELVGKEVTVPLDDASVTGTFVDVDEDGRLVLEANGSRRTVEAFATPFAASLPS